MIEMTSVASLGNLSVSAKTVKKNDEDINELTDEEIDDLKNHKNILRKQDFEETMNSSINESLIVNIDSNDKDIGLLERAKMELESSQELALAHKGIKLLCLLRSVPTKRGRVPQIQVLFHLDEPQMQVVHLKNVKRSIDNALLSFVSDAGGWVDDTTPGHGTWSMKEFKAVSKEQPKIIVKEEPSDTPTVDNNSSINILDAGLKALIGESKEKFQEASTNELNIQMELYQQKEYAQQGQPVESIKSGIDTIWLIVDSVKQLKALAQDAYNLADSTLSNNKAVSDVKVSELNSLRKELDSVMDKINDIPNLPGYKYEESLDKSVKTTNELKEQCECPECKELALERDAYKTIANILFKKETK